MHGAGPLVSIIIPARNEERNIRNCVESISRSDYEPFEIIVVDDRSDDRTAAVARAVDAGNAERLLVVDGVELPEGWLGKPWACEQGSREATGDYLLFTDADTTHEPELLSRAVRTLQENDADALTLMGRQVTGSFWEYLIQPQIFLLFLIRFPDLRKPLPPHRWRDAIANGQFILFTCATYEHLGRHESVKGEVVEDLRLAQLLVHGGYRFSIWLADDIFATRMYQSLGEIVEGWSKNVATATKMTLPRGLAAIAIPFTALAVLFYWVLPPVLAVMLAGGLVSSSLGIWGVGLTGFSLLFWMGVCYRFQVPLGYGFFYPLGGLAMVAIFARSWLRGSKVEWKGREYDVQVGS